MNMPPVRNPVMPEFDMTIITMADTLPSSGTSMVTSVFMPSLASSSGGACRMIFPCGALGWSMREDTCGSAPLITSSPCS